MSFAFANLSQGCCHLLGSCCLLAQKLSVVVRPCSFDMCRLRRDRFYVGVWPLIERSLIPKNSVLVNQRTSSSHCPKRPWAFPTWQKNLLEVLLILPSSLIQRPPAWIACGLDDAFPPRAAAGQSWTSLQSLVSCITIYRCHQHKQCIRVRTSVLLLYPAYDRFPKCPGTRTHPSLAPGRQTCRAFAKTTKWWKGNSANMTIGRQLW